MRRLPNTACRLACVLVCAGSVLAADGPKPKSPPTRGIAGHDYVYYNGQLVRFRNATAGKNDHVLLGPWRVGARSYTGKPRDGRPNLYIVVPGHQHHLEGFEAYDHSVVISGVPVSGKAVNWDVWWAIILDPRIREEFRSERELLMLTQQTFVLGETVAFDDVPAANFLRKVLKIDSLAELKRFRRRDKRMPRLAIIPAGFATRAIAGDFTAAAAK